MCPQYFVGLVNVEIPHKISLNTNDEPVYCSARCEESNPEIHTSEALVSLFTFIEGFSCDVHFLLIFFSSEFGIAVKDDYIFSNCI